MDRPLANKRCR